MQHSRANSGRITLLQNYRKHFRKAWDMSSVAISVLITDSDFVMKLVNVSIKPVRSRFVPLLSISVYQLTMSISWMWEVFGCENLRWCGNFLGCGDILGVDAKRWKIYQRVKNSNTLRTGHFGNTILKCMFVDYNICNLIKMPLKLFIVTPVGDIEIKV